ncbi:MAG: hypothetical protein ACYS8I_13955 [Planctomycetota bacterium]|jgi:hypothetical protein
MPDDHVVSLDANPASDKRNAGAGRCLARNCEERFRNGYRTLLQIDHAAHFKDDDPAALGLDRRGKRTGTTRLQISDAEDLPASAAGCIRSPSLGTRKSLDRLGEENSLVE